MIDFHSHILPKMDDGPQSVADCLAMLRRSFLQGVDAMVSTSHFYADEEYPRDFLRRRAEAYAMLQDAMLMSPEVYPRIILGAEVLYFPGIGEAEDISSLFIGNARTILIEPPMTPWSDMMLDEIARLGVNFDCIPVIAHVDRFMRYLRDDSLMDRVLRRDMRVQVNAEYFLNPETVKEAMENLCGDKIHLIGSDCHNLDSRAPNMGLAMKQARAYGAEAALKKLHQNAADLLLWRGRSV